MQSMDYSFEIVILDCVKFYNDGRKIQSVRDFLILSSSVSYRGSLFLFQYWKTTSSICEFNLPVRKFADKMTHRSFETTCSRKSVVE